MRLIDADALWMVTDGEHEYYERFEVEDAPTIEVPQWIPVTERLPEKGDVVLITNKNGNVRYGQFRGVDFEISGYQHWIWKNNTYEVVLAWMELPKAYEGE